MQQGDGAAAGRDPSTIIRSVLVRTLVGANQAELDRRKIALRTMLSDEQVADEFSPVNATRWIMGTIKEAHETVEVFARAGCQRLIFQDYLPRDLAMVDLLGREFASAARA